MFANAHLLALQLREIGKVEAALRSLLTSIAIRAADMKVMLKPEVLGIPSEANWSWSIPLPARRPFREAQLRIDSGTNADRPSTDLLGLMADVMATQRLVLASPELSLAQLAKREGRCRTHLARLLRLSWLSPQIVEAIADGTQPNGLTRRALLICDLPLAWADQERQFGMAT